MNANPPLFLMESESRWRSYLLSLYGFDLPFRSIQPAGLAHLQLTHDVILAVEFNRQILEELFVQDQNVVLRYAPTLVLLDIPATGAAVHDSVVRTCLSELGFSHFLSGVDELYRLNELCREAIRRKERQNDLKAEVLERINW